jgi:hypothetical protein
MTEFARPPVKTKHAHRPFNVLDDAEDLIREIWRADIPAFKPGEAVTFHDFMPDDPVIVETMHTLAELVAYSKQRARSVAAASPNNWMQAKFAQYTPSQYLPGLNTLLERHFGELIGRGTAKHGPVVRRHGLHASTEAVVNSFYIRAYSNIPGKDDIDAYLLACGIAQDQRPESFDFLLQGYCRTNVRLDRLVSLTHLIIAGAQSDTELSHDTLTHEYTLQELLKELRASYITECATMQLAFAKRPHGLNMLRKLSAFAGFDDKHAMALSVIQSRLEVGVEQFPLIVHATQKTQRLFKTIGQVLLGGFLATEVVKSLTEWASVIFHKNNAAYFIDLERVKVPALNGPLDVLLDQYYRFEMVSVYASVVTVIAVIGVTLFFKLRHHNSPNGEDSGSSHHH